MMKCNIEKSAHKRHANHALNEAKFLRQKYFAEGNKEIFNTTRYKLKITKKIIRLENMKKFPNWFTRHSPLTQTYKLLILSFVIWS